MSSLNLELDCYLILIVLLKKKYKSLTYYCIFDNIYANWQNNNPEKIIYFCLCHYTIRL